MNTFNKFLLLSVAFVSILGSCKKKPNNKNDNKEDEKPIEYPAPKDPETSSTIGFFMDTWKNKTYEVPSFTTAAGSGNAASVAVAVDASKILTKIPQSLYGQNSVSFIQNISQEEPLGAYLKDLKVSTIRFPGGSIADTYFWNGSFNTKPADAPEYLFDHDKEVFWSNNYWYGKNNPEKRANLEDYYSLLQKTNSEGVITVNYGYARYGLSDNPVSQAAHLAADWVRYDNGRTKYWEIGNENYGEWEKGFRINTANNKDGQPEFLSGKLFAQHAKVFMDSMRQAAQQTGKKIFIGVPVLGEYDSWLWSNSILAATWNSSIMTEMKTNGADYYYFHSYFLSNDQNTYEKIITSAEKKTGAFADYIKNDMSKNGLPVHPVSLSEYNIFAVGSAGAKQQVSFVNGMHTTIVLCEAIKTGIGSALRWDIANGWDNGADHGMFSKGDEPGAEKWNPRPVFYYMYYLQKMMGDRLLPSTSTNENILSYASSFSSGEKGVVLVNKSRKQEIVKIDVKNANIGKRYYWYTLTGGTDNDDFSQKVFVNDIGPAAPALGGPVATYKTIKANSLLASDGILITLPPRSVVFAVIDK